MRRSKLGGPCACGALPGLLLTLALVGPGTAAAAKPAPDTVLARAGARIVSRRGFEEALALQYPVTPADSITPKTRREFLQLLVDKEVLAQAALKSPPPLSPIQEAELRTLEDRLTMGVALDSLLGPYLALERAATARDTSLDTTAVAVNQRAQLRLRDSTLAGLRVRYAPAALETLAAAFRALPIPDAQASISTRLRQMSAMPPVRDTALVVAWSTGDTVRAADLLRGWRNLSPFFRPRVERAEQVRELSGNVFLERRVRRLAEAARLVERPDIRSRLDERHEYFAVSQYVDREVWHKVPQDSVTLRGFFAEHKDEWTLPEQVRVLRMESSSKAEADSIAATLHDPARAESLLAQSRRARINLQQTITAESDRVRFAQLKAAGPGAVVGPYPEGDRLVVARVLGVAPSRARDYDEVKGMVLKTWTEREGERLMRAHLDRLRSRERIWIHPDFR